MRKGSTPESSVPAALPVPMVHSAPTADSIPDDPAFAQLAASPALRAALRATLKANSCEGLLQADADIPLSNSALEIRRLDAQHVLVNVPCWRAAYNTGEGYWVARPKAPSSPRRRAADWATASRRAPGPGLARPSSRPPKSQQACAAACPVAPGNCRRW
ncbi:hypothetical protein G6F51_014066 [Rhizopus arrhizus]|uniref:Uncharacterized protein n=1 Tax=Rhizopus oryzae TaxID=64495 RepID=A0A9P6XP81_RHIOR|nr:hypothetical protein G6F51_014066 [Rhizopus arrhizus]